MALTSLEISIVKTVAYFDIFDYPLTVFEIWQYLEKPIDFLSVQKLLEAGNIPLETKHGFFFLPGREPVITSRQERYKATDKKIKKLRRRLPLIQWLPGIRLICLANSIGSHNLRSTSDNDLFIITKKSELWWVKFWATVILKLTGLRPTIKKSSNQLCLSFLIDESALELSQCRLTPHDRYFTYWLIGLVPLYGDMNMYSNLLRTNIWLSQAIPNWKIEKSKPPYRFTGLSPFSRFSPALPKIVERIICSAQQKIVSRALTKQANHNSGVIMTNSILKLHTTDRRPLFESEHTKRLTSLNLV